MSKSRELMGSKMEKEDRHEENAEFASGVLDVVRNLIGYLTLSATISPETIRRNLEQLKGPERSMAATMPIQRVIDDLDRTIANKRSAHQFANGFAGVQRR